MLDDKRSNNRVRLELPVICEIIDPLDKTTRKKNVICRDISISGMYFEIDEVLAINTEVNVVFQFSKDKNTIRAAIKTIRVETTEMPDRYGVGAAFINLSEKNQAEINNSLLAQLDINKLFELTIKKGASDLHLLVNHPPVLRIFGQIESLDMPELSAPEVTQLLYSIMSKEQIRKFEQDKELDFAIQYDMYNRFRINLHRQRGYLEATLRLINTKISSFEELNIPEIAKTLARQKDGLILIVGPTGSGKTTTVAAIVELINKERQGVIITLERPIEYIYANIKSIIKQREVGTDTNSFSIALKSTLRQDPNVIIVGELDDAETIRTALIAAEAGYLVVASFHAPNTIQGIDRLTSMFPVEHRKQILFQISNSLRGMIGQLLIPAKDRRKRLLATEVLICNDAVRRVLRIDELIQIPTIIQTGRSIGMQPMHDSIWAYFEKGLIDGETAQAYDNEFKGIGR